MTPQQSNVLSPITGWLLIDVWQEPPGEKANTVDQWVDTIVQNRKFFTRECVVNTSHGCSIDTFGNPDPFVQNTLALYCYNEPTADHDLIFRMMRASNSGYQNHEKICTHLSHVPSAVSLYDLPDFVKHCEVTLDGRVRNWLVAGQSWQMCTHDRGIGFKRLRSLVSQGYNFYITPWSILKEDLQPLNELDVRDDRLSWEVIPGFGWRLLAE